MSYFPPDWIPSYIGLILTAMVGAGFGFIFAVSTRAFSRWREKIGSDDALRRLDAKKHNEHLKLIGSFCNTLGAAIIGAAFIVPYIGNHAGPEAVDLRWVAAGLALPIAGHFALRFMKSEG